jgi:hypothetical protein
MIIKLSVSLDLVGKKQPEQKMKEKEKKSSKELNVFHLQFNFWQALST